MTLLTIQLDDKLSTALAAASRSEHVRPEDMVVDSLKQMLAMRWITDAQHELGPLAQAQGFQSEDDILLAWNGWGWKGN